LRSPAAAKTQLLLGLDCGIWHFTGILFAPVLVGYEQGY